MFYAFLFSDHAVQRSKIYLICREKKVDCEYRYLAMGCRKWKSKRSPRISFKRITFGAFATRNALSTVYRIEMRASRDERLQNEKRIPMLELETRRQTSTYVSPREWNERWMHYLTRYTCTAPLCCDLRQRRDTDVRRFFLAFVAHIRTHVYASATRYRPFDISDISRWKDQSRSLTYLILITLSDTSVIWIDNVTRLSTSSTSIFLTFALFSKFAQKKSD